MVQKHFPIPLLGFSIYSIARPQKDGLLGQESFMQAKCKITYPYRMIRPLPSKYRRTEKGCYFTGYEEHIMILTLYRCHQYRTQHVMTQNETP